jgi:hypothetical protein
MMIMLIMIMIMCVESGSVWNVSTFSCFKIISTNLSAKSKENYVKGNSEYPVFGLTIKPIIVRLRIMHANNATAKFGELDANWRTILKRITIQQVLYK